MTVERLPVRPKKPKQAGCPICGLPAAPPHGPFCSKRCKEVDLGRWFSGSYAIPASEPPDSADLEELVEAIEAESGREDDG